jgi:hypothetical protein
MTLPHDIEANPHPVLHSLPHSTTTTAAPSTMPSSPTSTLKRVRSPEQERRVRGEVPIELVGAILEKTDAFVVTFDSEADPRNPQNWS